MYFGSSVKVLLASTKRGFQGAFRPVVSLTTSFYSIKEATTRTIKLDEDDPILIDKMLHYLYETDYEDPESIGDKSPDTGVQALLDEEGLSFAEYHPDDNGSVALQDEAAYVKMRSLAEIYTRMYTIGDKYDVPGLRDCAKQKFDSTITSDWHPESFVPIIKLVYGSYGPQEDGLRTIVCNMALQNLSSLKCDSYFVALLQEQREFANDFTLAMIEKITATDGADQSNR